MIYLDHAAATPVDPRVLKIMLPYFSEKFANPSSIYQFALQNRQAIDAARKQVSEILGSKFDEIYFTGSGTESNNWAIFGAAEAAKKPNQPGHLITSVIEHHSVLNSFEELERRGWEVTYLNVDENGHISLEKLKAAVRPETVLVSIAYANNEIGTIENITEIGKFLKDFNQNIQGSRGPKTVAPNGKNSHRVLFHTDACQAAGALPLNVHNLNVDLMTVNGGKIYGPKGSGILYIREGVKIVPLLYGGGQEHRQRAGTENVPAIIGFGEALTIAESLRPSESKRLSALRDRLIAGLQKGIPHTRLNGDPIHRLPNNINVCFEGVDSESLLLRLDMAGVCASAGSACTSGALEPSHVLMALGVEKDIAKSSIRLTLGRGNTLKDITSVLEILPKLVKDLRQKK